MAGSVAVARSGIYLGVPVGPDSIGREFDVAVMKDQARCTHIRCVPGFVAESFRACQMFAISVLLFIAQLAELPPRAKVVEASAMAGMLAAPMYAITATALSAVAHDVRSFAFQPITLQCRAVLLRFVFKHRRA